MCVYAYVFSIQSVSFHGVKRSNLEKHIRHPNVSQLNMGIEMRPQTTLLVSKKDMETQSDKKQDIYQIGGSNNKPRPLQNLLGLKMKAIASFLPPK